MKFIINNKEYQTKKDYQRDVYLELEQFINMYDPALMDYINIRQWLNYKLASNGLELLNNNPNKRDQVKHWKNKLGIN